MITIRQNFAWQFEGKFPDVPFAEGVNEEELLQVDPDPLFLTLPIVQDGLTASDGLIYRPAFNERIMQTILNKKIGGNMGHHSLWFSNSRSETDPIQWVGAIRDEDGRYWAKGFIKNEDVKKHFKTKKAVGAKVGTSIMGFAEPGAIVYHDNGTYDVDPERFHLRYIDIIDDPDDAALSMEREFNLTAHSRDFTSEEKDTDNMTITSVDQVPAEIRQQIEQAVRRQLEQNDEVEELRQSLETVESQLAQARADNEKMAKALFNSRLNELITNSIDLKGLASEDENILATFVRNSVRAEMGADLNVDNAQEAIDAVLQSDAYKRLAKTVVEQASGGRAFVGGDDTPEKTAGELIEENIDDLIAEWGIS